jgi:hypothetical protein
MCVRDFFVLEGLVSVWCRCVCFWFGDCFEFCLMCALGAVSC